MQTRFEETLIPDLTEILKLRQELLDNSIENGVYSSHHIIGVLTKLKISF